MSTIHLKDPSKKTGIRCNRWHTAMCYIVEDTAKVTCKGCAGIKRAPPRFPPKERALNVGDILSASWGYDQTNVDFYQVTRLVGAMSVEIRKITQRLDHEEVGSDYVLPNKGSFIPEWTDDKKDFAIRRASGTGVSVDDCRYASLWSGKPMYETALGWGH